MRILPQHARHERDQMPHQCTQHKHLVQVPNKWKTMSYFGGKKSRQREGEILTSHSSVLILGQADDNNILNPHGNITMCY